MASARLPPRIFGTTGTRVTLGAIRIVGENFLDIGSRPGKGNLAGSIIWASAFPRRRGT